MVCEFVDGIIDAGLWSKAGPTTWKRAPDGIRLVLLSWLNSISTIYSGRPISCELDDVMVIFRRSLVKESALIEAIEFHTKWPRDVSGHPFRRFSMSGVLWHGLVAISLLPSVIYGRRRQGIR